MLSRSTQYVNIEAQGDTFVYSAGMSPAAELGRFIATASAVLTVTRFSDGLPYTVSLSDSASPQWQFATFFVDTDQSTTGTIGMTVFYTRDPGGTGSGGDGFP